MENDQKKAWIDEENLKEIQNYLEQKMKENG